MQASNAKAGTLGNLVRNRLFNVEQHQISDAADEALIFAEAVIETIREPLLVLDRSLRVQLANNSFYKTFLVDEQETLGQLVYDLGNDQWDIPRLRTLLDEVLSKDREFNNFEVDHVFRDLGRRHMLLNARKLTRGGGREELILLAIADVTARHRADATAERLAAIVKYSDDAIVAKDLNGIVSDWNIGAQRLFGFTAEEIVGKSIKTVIPPERHSEEDDILAKIRRGEHIDHFETVRMRKDGSEVWVSLTISPLKNAEGQIMGASKIARDMTERRRADEQRRTLIGELNHRVKNMMATVQAVAAQTLSSAATIDDAREAFSARLIALAKAHDALTRENWEGADIANVVKATVEPYSGGQNRFTIDGPSVRLQPGAALSFSMAVHELCTNAAKYGALSTPDGRVGIGWRLVGQRERQELHLRWTEQGGPPVTESKRKGFGSRLIERGLAMELGGEVTVSYDPSGVVCTIRAPLWLEGEGNDPACREAAQPSES